MKRPECSLFVFSLLLFAIKGTFCWDNQELELFDLVEEVNANFYEVLGVDQSAPSLDIRRAYRKLSVKLHPDKNKEEGAEERFRQIVAVYEVLKDETQRNRYNDILVNGLPDWRTPVYYYRKARKLGLLELAILLLVIVTVGQFIVGWSMYLERKYEMEEVFLSKKKKDKKGKKAKKAEEDMDEALQEHLDTLPRPRLTDLVPCRLVLGLVSLVTSVPTWPARIKEWQEERRMKQQEETSEEESEVDETEERVKRPKRRQRVDIPEFDDARVDGAPVVYLPDEANHTEEKREDRSGKEWTDDEISLLAKAVAKFPSGTSNRWEKIADLVGRSVSEVTAKSRSIKQNVTKSVDPASQGLTGSVNEKVAFKKGQTLTDDISRPMDRVPAPPAASAAATGPTPATGPTSAMSDQWTQTQQKTLEWALSQYPKGTPERWDKISEHITGKTKEECLIRFKYLAEVIRRKKGEAAIAAKR